MKFQFILLLFIGILLSCNSNEDKVDSTEKTLSTSQGTKKLKIIDKAAFNQIADAFHDQSLVNRFCSESKGYQQKVWLGLNKCSWAIEQYVVDQLAPLVRRQDDSLSLQAKDGSSINFIHQRGQKSGEVYYQFKKYFSTIQFYLIEELREAGCPKQILVDKQTVKQTPFTFNGLLSFSPSLQRFALWNSTGHCPPALEVWTLKDRLPVKVWSANELSGTISSVKWINDKELGLKVNEGDGVVYWVVVE